MPEPAWRELIVDERMAVDREFADRIEASRFTRSEWDLLMTAVEFRIDRTDETATLVAETDRLHLVFPEPDLIARRRSAMAGGRWDRLARLFERLGDAVGLGGGVDDATRAEACRLADEYAGGLHRRLVATGKWDRIVAEATDQPSPE